MLKQFGTGFRVAAHVFLMERSQTHERYLYDITLSKREDIMNKDRIEGSVEQAKGKVKEVAGKVAGDSKLETEGKAQQIAGKVQNTVGGFKDTVKEVLKH